MNAQLNPQSLASSATFVKIGADGQPLPLEATNHAAVFDPTTNLMHAVGVCSVELTEEGTEELIVRLNAERHAGFDDWRVPTVKEGFSITDHTRYSPAANTEFFPDMQSDWYRTSTPTAWSSDGVFCVHFGYGGVDGLGRDGRAFVRPVRSVSSGQ
jgi:hypothetical protein